MSVMPTQALSELSLGEDITAELVAAAATIPKGQVAKADSFLLFQGTQALEAGNSRLDLWVFAGSEVGVEWRKAALTMDEAVGVVVRLSQMLAAWLDNAPLSTLVLACQYCEELLGMDGRAPVLDPSTPEGLVTVYACGVLKFVGFVLMIAKSGVVYEEEDLMSHHFGFLYLSKVETLEIQRALDAVDSALEVAPYCRLVAALLEMEAMLAWNVPVVDDCPGDLAPAAPVAASYGGLERIDAADKALEALAKFGTVPPPPPHVFSTAFQARVDNLLPPKPLTETAEFETHLAVFRHLVADWRHMMTLARPGLTASEVHDFLVRFGNRRFPPPNVVVRGFLQLWVVRNDRLLLGNPGFALQHLSLAMSTARRYALDDTGIGRVMESVAGYLGPPDGISAAAWDSLSPRVWLVCNQLDAYYLEQVALRLHNPCRQRLHLNRSLKQLDELQVHCEDIELAVYSATPEGARDATAHSGGLIPAMPLSLYVYYLKLVAMAEYLLRGVELALYKPFELASVYWYACHLLTLATRHLDLVLLVQLDQRLAGCDEGKLKAKAKKLSGEKKARFRQKMEYRVGVVGPRLQRHRDMLTREGTYFGALAHMCSAARDFLFVVDQAGPQHLPVPANLKVLLDRLFAFRFKSFLSIGAPPQLTYKAYLAASTAPIAVAKPLGEVKVAQDWLASLPAPPVWCDALWLARLGDTCAQLHRELTALESHLGSTFSAHVTGASPHWWFVHLSVRRK